MALADLTKEAVLTAVKEFKQLGREGFLRRHGFKHAWKWFLVSDGVDMDSKAIAGVAHGYLPGQSPLRFDQFTGGEQSVVDRLRRLDFEVVNRHAEQARNPPWSRDELILALDLYMTNPKSPSGKSSAAVGALSDLLNRLATQLHQDGLPTFRNINGVYMKMMNFRRFDPEVIASGRVGLTRGGKDEEAVWEEFSHDLRRLRQVADAIRLAVEGAISPSNGEDEDDLCDMEAPEGRILTKLHKTRERNRKLVKRRKEQALSRTGRLACEVCGFDFADRYGPRGAGFIEAHHTKPVHTLTTEGTTRLSDLALVCSNCHRMIHASRPWLTLADLSGVLRDGVSLPSASPR